MYSDLLEQLHEARNMVFREQELCREAEERASKAEMIARQRLRDTIEVESKLRATNSKVAALICAHRSQLISLKTELQTLRHTTTLSLHSFSRESAGACWSIAAAAFSSLVAPAPPIVAPALIAHVTEALESLSTRSLPPSTALLNTVSAKLLDAARSVLDQHGRLAERVGELDVQREAVADKLTELPERLQRVLLDRERWKTQAADSKEQLMIEHMKLRAMRCAPVLPAPADDLAGSTWRARLIP